MPITVRVQNFQSIEDATVVIDGFTVITGSNNSGKTAFMRAVRGVFLNSPPGPIVRRGSAHLTVTIDFGDGNTVKWEKGWEKPEKKGKTINRYHVNGKQLADVGRGCPPEVLALGMNPIKAGSDAVWPQIADQFKGVLFLVGSPGSSMAEAIANVDRVGKLSAALKLSESERRSIVSKLKVRRSDEKDLAAEAEAFAGIDEVDDQVFAIETSTKEAETLFTEYAVARSLRKRWKAANAEVSSLKGVEGVELPPDTSDIELARDTLADLIQIRSTIDNRRTEVELLSGIEAVDVPGSEAATASKTLRDDLVDLRRLSARLKASRATMTTMEGYDDVELPDATKPTKIKVVVTFFKGIKERRDTALSTIEQLKEALRLADVEQTTSEQGVTTLLGELGECPTCGTVTKDGKHVHGKVA